MLIGTCLVTYLLPEQNQLNAKQFLSERHSAAAQVHLTASCDTDGLSLARISIIPVDYQFDKLLQSP
jgi:hypothetical protein